MTHGEFRHFGLSGNAVGLLIAVLLLLSAAVSYFNYAADDAFISFRYARNLADGKGLTWNEGERLEAYSNFLWVLILAAACKIGLPIVLTAKILGILSGVGVLILAYRLAQEVAGSHAPLWFAPVVLAFNRDLIFWMPTGMETVFYSFLLLAASYRYLCEIADRSAFPWSGVLFLLVALCRPEGIVFFVATVLFDAAYWRRMRWRAFFLFFVPLVIYHVWRMLYFGDFLPNPYYAKIGGDQRFLLGAAYVSGYLFKYLPFFVILSLTILFPPEAAGRVLYLFWLALAGVGAVLWMDGDWMWHYRLLLPVTVLLGVLLVPAVAGLTRAAATRDRRAAWPVTLLGLLLLHQATGASLRDLVLLSQKPMSGCLEGELTVAMRNLGEWIQEHSESDDLIAVNHAGALPFYAERPALDMTGLCNRHIARVPGGRHEKYDPDYVLSQNPRYVVLNTSVRPTDGAYGRDYWEGETALYDHPLFKERYEPIPRYWAWRWDAVQPAVTYTVVFASTLPKETQRD